MIKSSAFGKVKLMEKLLKSYIQTENKDPRKCEKLRDIRNNNSPCT